MRAALSAVPSIQRSVMAAAGLGVSVCIPWAHALRVAGGAGVPHAHAFLAPAPTALLTGRVFADHGGVGAAAGFGMGLTVGRADAHAAGAGTGAAVEEARAFGAPAPTAL